MFYPVSGWFQVYFQSGSGPSFFIEIFSLKETTTTISASGATLFGFRNLISSPSSFFGEPGLHLAAARGGKLALATCHFVSLNVSQGAKVLANAPPLPPCTAAMNNKQFSLRPDRRKVELGELRIERHADLAAGCQAGLCYSVNTGADAAAATAAAVELFTASFSLMQKM